MAGVRPYDDRMAVHLISGDDESLVLTGVALNESDWGFLLLEAVWAIVSAWGRVQFARGRTPSAAAH